MLLLGSPLYIWLDRHIRDGLDDYLDRNSNSLQHDICLRLDEQLFDGLNFQVNLQLDNQLRREVYAKQR